MSNDFTHMILVSIKKTLDEQTLQFPSGSGGLGEIFHIIMCFCVCGNANLQWMFNSENRTNLFLTIRICPVKVCKCEYGMQLWMVHINGNWATHITWVMPVAGRKSQRPQTSIHKSSKKKSSLSTQRYDFPTSFNPNEGLLWLPLPLFSSSRFFHETAFRNYPLTFLEVLLLWSFGFSM